MRKNARRLFVIVFCLTILFDWLMIYRLQSCGKEETDVHNARIEQELTCFPIPKSTKDADLGYSYVDSWMFERSYGGDRRHEGCDIMVSENTRGIYPVVSMTDGVLESIGWLKLGGYRIGIRSASGTYYYYAHMESYAEYLQEGMSVKAGEFLGFVGDSGYGSEGTTGQFAVHLHVGIYVPDASGKDVAVNPYPYLKKLENRHLYAGYLCPGKETEE